MKTVNAYAASEAGGKLNPFKYILPNLGSDQVDIKVHYCGICHSDLSMLYNAWGMTQYPFVPGHEIVGEAENGIEAVDLYKKLKPDLVTMDITMREKDGIEAAEDILAMDPTARIIMVTALGQENLLTKSFLSLHATT